VEPLIRLADSTSPSLKRHSSAQGSGEAVSTTDLREWSFQRESGLLPNIYSCPPYTTIEHIPVGNLRRWEHSANC